MSTSCSSKGIIKKNFSRYAHLYDNYASVQYLAATRLIGYISSDSITNILEIGCGTGNYTLLLKKKFKTARIKAVDLSGRMTEIAKQKSPAGDIEFIVQDAEELDLAGKFELITSNVSFQWFDNLELAIAKYKDALIENGTILFSTFGPLTFHELGRSLKEVLGEKAVISSGNFLRKTDMERILNKYFRYSTITELVVKERYLSLAKLLNKIKYTGAKGSGVDGFPVWNRTMLSRIEDVYKSIFGAIEASYQIFFCKGIK